MLGAGVDIIALAAQKSDHLNGERER